MKTQHRSTFWAAALAAAGFLCGLNSNAATYFEVFTEADVTFGVPSAFLDTVATKGGDAYAILRDTTGADTGSVVKYDGSTFTQIMTPGQWTGAGATTDLAGFLGAAVVDRGFGEKVRVVNFFDNSIWEIDTVTGTPAQVVSTAMIDAFTAGSVNLTASNAMLPDGTVLAYDGTSDSVLQITPGGFVFNVISSAELTALTGSDILSGTGFALVGTDLYFGSNSSDELYKWNIVTDTGSVVLTEAQLEALSDDIDGTAGVDDIYAAPDGLIYFYEDDADYLYSFDPADPAGSLSVVLTEAELNSGPGTDAIAQLSWWKGGIAWTDQSDGFYALVPEPASLTLMLAALAGAAGVRRRV